ncbi:aldo/keto reductase [Solihabitans fulvus]|uniref:Aldo/keto reductase n=1 Tax=Solihabitans fulvus TaxID=1892852 RepID=A0A5B2XA41_9PSEU|nr:aldo/keto reductase [Solihabitans fulvus]KAA2260074.1 aldo/keto reductase [Solihabitans fulvus]
MTKLGTSDLDVFPLCLGGNVFGWTADREQSFAVLDAYAATGGNFVDTADVYSAWAPGNSGGESETIIGEWLAARGNRDDVVVATKVGMLDGLTTLSSANIRTAAENSLRRLGVDHIDLYYAHQDDAGTPLEETLSAFDALVRDGKVRHIAASNFTPARLSESLAVSAREGLASYVALQPHYNLVERAGYEQELATVVADAKLSAVPYFSLAKGFLTGKYRPGVEVDSPRARGAGAYLDERGGRVLAALDEIAAAHDTTVAAVSLAWLAAQPTVAAPIASARTPEQLAELLPVASLTLTGAELGRLDAASS